jgi:hypothetical protein
MERKRISPPRSARSFCCIVCAFLFLMACSLPFNLPFLKPAIQISGPTPTMVNADWKTLVYDTFDNSTGSFIKGKWDAIDAIITISAQNGKSIWRMTTQKDIADGIADINVPTSFGDSLGDFYASIEGRQTACSTVCEYGFWFRNSDKGSYVFSIQEQKGTFSFYSSDRGTVSITSYNLDTPSSAIQGNGSNILAVKAEGINISIYINDILVNQIQSNISPKGTMGIYVSVSGTGSEAEFEFDNFQVYGP